MNKFPVDAAMLREGETSVESARRIRLKRLPMHDSTLETRLAELESRLAFQEITIEDLNKTVTAHEIEMAKMREHMRLMIEKLKATQPSHIASRQKRRHRRIIEA
jgi:SlyX protein